MMSASTALVASMRNEGPFLLEWVAYHRAIGFDRIVICSNDCTDGSDLLLDALAAAGALTHLPNAVPPGSTPQDAGMTRAMAHLTGTDAVWLCHLDSDEYLNIGLGDGRVADLIATAGQADAIALPWHYFGDNGLTEWPGGTLPAFTACAATPDPETVKFKSMFRFRNFRHATAHMPTQPTIPVPKVVNANGEGLPNAALLGKPRSKYLPLDRAIRLQAACVNHYAVRSEDVFLMKNDRGDGEGKRSDKYHLGSRWHRIANRNDTQDRSILRHWPATQAEMQVLRAESGVAAAEAACNAAFAARKAVVLTPATRQAWTRPTAGVAA